jgi:hypothetical protein
MSAARTDPDLVAGLVDWVGDGALVLADLGYEGEPGLFRIPVKRPAGLLKTTYKALRHYRGCPWRLGDIVGAALVLLHQGNHRTT